MKNESIKKYQNKKKGSCDMLKQAGYMSNFTGANHDQKSVGWSGTLKKEVQKLKKKVRLRHLPRVPSAKMELEAKTALKKAQAAGACTQDDSKVCKGPYRAGSHPGRPLPCQSLGHLAR